MKKRVLDEYPTKSQKRQIKKRLRMRVHSRSLKTAQSHAGGLISLPKASRVRPNKRRKP